MQQQQQQQLVWDRLDFTRLYRRLGRVGLLYYRHHSSSDDGERGSGETEGERGRSGNACTSPTPSPNGFRNFGFRPGRGYAAGGPSQAGELPARYGRLQMSEEEMELVEMGGAA